MPVHLHKTNDVGQLRAVHGGWEQHYTQCSPGRFEGSISHLDLDGVTLFEERMNTRIEQVFRVPADALVFSFDIHANHFHVLTPALQNAWITPPHYHEVSLVFRHGMATPARLEGLQDLLLRPLRSSKASLFASWLGYQMRHCADQGMRPTLAALPLFEDCLQVVEGAQCALANGVLRRERRNRHLVQRCHRLLQDGPPGDVSALDLARQLELTLLQLTTAFQDYLGVTPTVWLRLHRLNLVRRDLLEARGGRTTVAEVAMRHGFWHLSRFANQYARLFGERPKDTLRPG